MTLCPPAVLVKVTESPTAMVTALGEKKFCPIVTRTFAARAPDTAAATTKSTRDRKSGFFIAAFMAMSG